MNFLPATFVFRLILRVISLFSFVCVRCHCINPCCLALCFYSVSNTSLLECEGFSTDKSLTITNCFDAVFLCFIFLIILHGTHWIVKSMLFHNFCNSLNLVFPAMLRLYYNLSRPKHNFFYLLAILWNNWLFTVLISDLLRSSHYSSWQVSVPFGWAWFVFMREPNH